MTDWAQGNAARAERQEARHGRWAVAMMFIANGFVMGSWAVQIPLLLPRHQITEAVLGVLILVFGIGAVSAMLFAGRLIARHGAQRMTRLFGLATAGTLALVVLSPNLWLLALALALMGGVLGCMDVAMNANAVDVERRLGRAIMSSSHGFWSFGGFLGGTLGGFVVQAIGREGHALAVSGVTLALVLAGLPWLLAGRAQAQTAHENRPTSVWPKGAAVYILGLMALLSMVPEGAVLDWAALYLIQDLDVPVAKAGLAFGLFSAAMALMRFAGDAIRDQFGAVKTLRFSGFVAATAMLAAAFAPNMPLAVGCFAVCGLGVANMVPVLFSAAGNMPDLPDGVGISTVSMLGYAGILIAPSSIGFVAEHIGFRVTYAVLALLLFGVATLASRAAAADLPRS